LAQSGKHHEFTAFEGEDVQQFSDVTAEILLDPKFWQALGKTMGWEKENEEVYIELPEMQEERRLKLMDIEDNEGVILRRENLGVIVAPYALNKKYSWRKEWHRMIDALASDQTIEQYFETL
jgi:hypothetical protein